MERAALESDGQVVAVVEVGSQQRVRHFGRLQHSGFGKDGQAHHHGSAHMAAVMVEGQRFVVVARVAFVRSIHVVQPQEFRDGGIRFFCLVQLVMLGQRRQFGQFAKQGAAAKSIQAEQQQKDTGHDKVI